VLILLSAFCMKRKVREPHTSSNPNGQPIHAPPWSNPGGQPIHPPHWPYQCRHCGSTNLTYRRVLPTNRNGNGGRPYCVCENRHCSDFTRLNADQQDTGWVSWVDGIGVTPGNPLCECRNTARLDTAGESSNVPGRHFWTCSTGACNYTSWRLDGGPGWGDGF
jgi:hypothetical protein